MAENPSQLTRSRRRIGPPPPPAQVTRTATDRRHRGVGVRASAPLRRAAAPYGVASQLFTGAFTPHLLANLSEGERSEAGIL